MIAMITPSLPDSPPLELEVVEVAATVVVCDEAAPWLALWRLKVGCGAELLDPEEPAADAAGAASPAAQPQASDEISRESASSRRIEPARIQAAQASSGLFIAGGSGSFA